MPANTGECGRLRPARVELRRALPPPPTRRSELGIQVETEDPGAVAALNSIKVALEKAEEGNPGIVHELIDCILESEQVRAHPRTSALL